MFGKVRYIDPEKDAHYKSVAKRFAMDAKLLRKRAAIHLESKADIPFWSGILKHYVPDANFHFITSSQNENGQRTAGVTQCLKFFDYLSPEFFICIDSDYRYLLGDERMDVKNYVLQTYSYSFENHLCFAKGLNIICEEVTGVSNNVFDFNSYLKSYSKMIYPLFLWHLYFMPIDQNRFTKYDFNNYLLAIQDFRRIDIKNNGAKILKRLKNKIKVRLREFEAEYPKADLSIIENRYGELGLRNHNCYLFVRGHNVYEMIRSLCKEVCKVLIRQNYASKYQKEEAIREIYKNRHLLDTFLNENIQFGRYPLITQIGNDVKHLFDTRSRGKLKND